MLVTVRGCCSVLAVAVVDSTPVDVVCGMERAEKCLYPLRDLLEEGVSSLATLNDDGLASACW